MIAPPSARWKAPLGLAVSLFILNASLTFENVWPTPRIRWASTASVELAVCALLLVLVHRHARRLTRTLLPGLWVLLVAGHYVDVTAPGLYGRELNLYWDSRYFGDVAAMLTRSVPWWQITLAIGGSLVALWTAYRIARLALGQIAAAAERAALRRILGAAAASAVILFTGQHLSDRASRWIDFAHPATAAYARQVRFVASMVGPGAVAPELGPSPALDATLHGLGGSDVLVVFAESYGAVTWETPAMSSGLAQSRRNLDTAIRDTGRQVISAYVESPTFGGSSWLAHLTLMSGVEVRDQYAYTSLMASNRDTVVKMFGRRGYRTVALMPGMRQAWPEGAFYGFDMIYGHDELGYRGPRFGWWEIPDQYALAKLDALEGTGRRAPLFVVFPTSTTHAPFGPVAPYQPDWSRILGEDAFDRADVERSMAHVPDLADLRPSYVRAMAYEYSALAGYLRQRADDPIVIVLGDHQPAAAVTGPDAPWRVPVHVIGRHAAVLQRLIAHGFSPGLAPRAPSIGGMHTLVPMLLDAFDAPPEPAPSATATR